MLIYLYPPTRILGLLMIGGLARQDVTLSMGEPKEVLVEDRCDGDGLLLRVDSEYLVREDVTLLGKLDSYLTIVFGWPKLVLMSVNHLRYLSIP